MKYFISLSLLLVNLAAAPAYSASLVGSWTCPNPHPPAGTAAVVHYRFSADGKFVLTSGSTTVPGIFRFTGNQLCLSYGGSTCVSGAAGTDTITVRWLSASSYQEHDPQAPAGSRDLVCKRNP
ncbi:MAG TPA: hypothetical protein VEJ20_07205 [Candidatus Eremiobacteraceae bacterium]|nr:hypothetical protein [Candidatus Eremiobacteraceae bacterium]